MAETPATTPQPDRVVSKIVVPSDQSMVALLGSRDEVLRTVERVLSSDVHVRGNEITVTGSPADNATADERNPTARRHFILAAPSREPATQGTPDRRRSATRRGLSIHHRPIRPATHVQRQCWAPHTYRAGVNVTSWRV